MRDHTTQWDVWERLDKDQQRALDDLANLAIELRGLISDENTERLAHIVCDLGWVDTDLA